MVKKPLRSPRPLGIRLLLLVGGICFARGACAEANASVTSTITAGRYTIVSFGVDTSVPDGSFSKELGDFVASHPEARIVTIAPLNVGATTTAVVVVVEGLIATATAAVPGSGVKHTMTRDEFDRLNKSTPTATERVDPSSSRPRPSVVKQQQVRPAIFTENLPGTQNIGATAYSALWTNYGQYLQKLIETVQVEWERILKNNDVRATSGGSLKIAFRVNSAGAISQIVATDGNAGAAAEKACVSAITARAPYGKWSSEMIAVLGQSQDLTFTFFFR